MQFRIEFLTGYSDQQHPFPMDSDNSVWFDKELYLIYLCKNSVLPRIASLF